MFVCLIKKKLTKACNVGYDFGLWKERIHRLKRYFRVWKLRIIALSSLCLWSCFFALHILIALVKHPNFVLTLIWPPFISTLIWSLFVSFYLGMPPNILNFSGSLALFWLLLVLILKILIALQYRGVILVRINLDH